MKVLLTIALLAISFLGARSLVFHFPKNESPIVFVPNNEVISIIENLILTNQAKLYDGKVYQFFNLSEIANGPDKRNYKLVLAKINSGGTDVITRDLSIQNIGQTIRISTTDISGNPITLTTVDQASDLSFGISNNTGQFVVTDTYKFLLLRKGILSTPSTDQSRIADLSAYFPKNSSFQCNGIIIALPYSFLNDYFSNHPVLLGDVNFSIQSMNISNSAAQQVVINMTLAVKSPAFGITTSITIDPASGKVTGHSPFIYQGVTPINKPLADDAAAKIDDFFTQKALNKALMVNMSNNNLYFLQSALNAVSPIPQNAEILYYNDNVILKIIS